MTRGTTHVCGCVAAICCTPQLCKVHNFSLMNRANTQCYMFCQSNHNFLCQQTALLVQANSTPGASNSIPGASKQHSWCQKQHSWCQQSALDPGASNQPSILVPASVFAVPKCSAWQLKRFWNYGDGGHKSPHTLRSPHQIHTPL